MNFKELINKYLKEGKNKNFSNLILIFLIGVVLVITASFFSSSSGTAKSQDLISKNGLDKTNNTTAPSTAYEADMENKLKSILSQMDGVGRVVVMVTLDSGEETVPALNSNESSSTTEESSSGGKSSTSQGNSSNTVVTSNDSSGTTSPFIVKVNKPKARSIMVVAEGAENSLTQLRITKSVMDLFDVSDSKVNVYPMKK